MIRPASRGDFYVRQLWDGQRFDPQIDFMEPGVMAGFGRHVRLDPRPGSRPFGGPHSDRRLPREQRTDLRPCHRGRTTIAYADQNDLDYEAVVATIADGQLEAAPETPAKQ